MDTLVAAAGIATAVGTAFLAIATYRMASEARRSGEIALDGLRAQLRPTLVPAAPADVPTASVTLPGGTVFDSEAGVAVRSERGRGDVVVAVTNIGPGVAVISSAELLFPSQADWGTAFWTGYPDDEAEQRTLKMYSPEHMDRYRPRFRIDRATLPVATSTWIALSFSNREDWWSDFEHAATVRKAALVVEVRYRDLNNTNNQKLDLWLQADRDHVWGAAATTHAPDPAAERAWRDRWRAGAKPPGLTDLARDIAFTTFSHHLDMQPKHKSDGPS